MIGPEARVQKLAHFGWLGAERVLVLSFLK
jgi:hypothetical protein